MDNYNKDFKKWRGPIHNDQFRSQNLKDKRNTDETCTKYAGSEKFNGIPREGNPATPIKSYKDQCREHMIRNGIWGVFYLPDPHSKYKKWDILIHQSRYPLDHMKIHVQSIQKVYEADQYVVQNLTWSGVYIKGSLSNTLLQKVLIFVLLTTTVPEVFVTTMTKFISNYDDALQETLTHTKSLKLKCYPGRMLNISMQQSW